MSLLGDCSDIFFILFINILILKVYFPKTYAKLFILLLFANILSFNEVECAL